MFCELLLNNLSRAEAKEQLGKVLRFAILFTVVDVVLVVFHAKQFGLDKHFGAKLYHAFSVLLGVVFMPGVWNLYFCYRQRASEEDDLS